LCPCAEEPRTRADGLRGQRSHRTIRAEHTALGFVQHEREIVASKARVELGGTRDVEPLGGDVEFGHRALGFCLPSFITVGESRHPALDEEVLV
jgi:hypothetical protein